MRSVKTPFLADLFGGMGACPHQVKKGRRALALSPFFGSWDIQLLACLTQFKKANTQTTK